MIPIVSVDELQWMDEDLIDVFDADASVGTEVTYQSIDATAAGYSFDPTTGIHTIGHTDAAITVILGELTQVEAGRHQTGRWIMLVRSDDLGAIMPKMADRIIHGSEVYEVETADRAVLGKVWRLRVRKH